IYAEITLIYRNKNYTPQEWTYPDYRSFEYAKIFLKIRQLYLENRGKCYRRT
ncbi:MAG: DUF4416 family protein, partial [Candidatus Omnitrophica bacterium]|nr:DUF4416 family protein [Candidatus Omnitrophota bacterium]